jgi:hypothetical protein
MIANVSRCTPKMKSRIVIGKTAFSKKKVLFTSKLDLRKQLMKFCFSELFCMVLNFGHVGK